MSDISNKPRAESEARDPSRLSRRNALKAGATGMASMAGMAWALTLGHGGVDLVKELAHLAQGRPMTAARLADILRTERAQWNALLAQVGPNRMDIPGVEGTWSVKELVAHLTWYERRWLTERGRSRAQGRLHAQTMAWGWTSATLASPPRAAHGR